MVSYCLHPACFQHLPCSLHPRVVHLLGYGSALIDITLPVGGDFDLDELGITPNTHAANVPDHVKASLLSKAFQNEAKEITCGGAALNTLRIFRALSPTNKYASTILRKRLPHELTCSILGAVGDDKAGEFVVQSCQAAGVDCSLLQIFAGQPSGACLCLVDKGARTMIALNGAVLLLDPERALRDDTLFLRIMQSHAVYVTTFQLTTPNRVVLARHMLQVCARAGVPFCLNLSSSTLVSRPSIRAIVLEFLSQTSIVFGNLDELSCLLKPNSQQQHEKNHGGDSSGEEPFPTEQGKSLVFSLFEKLPSSAMAVFTNGWSAAIVGVQMYSESPIVVVCPRPPELSKEDIVDAVGAGDAFVAGFLAQHLSQSCPQTVHDESSAESAVVKEQNSYIQHVLASVDVGYECAVYALSKRGITLPTFTEVAS